MDLYQTPPQDLAEVWEWCWRLLGRAAADPKDALHTMTLVTQDGTYPTARSVILRRVDRIDGLLECHTDIRSYKIETIQQHPRVSWHGWHQRRRMQLRIKAEAICHHQDEQAAAAWRELSPSSRINYSAKAAPGQSIAAPSEGWAAYTAYKDLESAQPETWFPHFVLIRTVVREIEWLWLRREGHVRATLWKESEAVVGSWLIP